MKKNERLEIFKLELSFIKDADVRKFTELCLSQLPDYFFQVPASSTGKYHPKFSLGDGGLVRHTQCAVRLANELLNIDMFIPLVSDRSYIIASLILHDGLKHGNPMKPYTTHEHPIEVSEFIMNLAKTKDEKSIAIMLGELIKSHMGQWTTNKRSKVVLPKPTNKRQNLVHLCDLIVSRKLWDDFYPNIQRGV